jgi:hypothetical protein
MKLRWITLVPAAAMSGAMAIAANLNGWHSTEGLWATILNLPGSIVGGWTEALVGESFLLYVVIALVNWAFYFWTIKGVLFLKHKLSK